MNDSIDAVDHGAQDITGRVPCSRVTILDAFLQSDVAVFNRLTAPV